MASADEILASLNGYEDNVCIIDNDLRTIIIPKTITTLGVEMDDDVHRLYFQIPRVYCGIDLSTFDIRINYINANAEGDIYVVTDKEIGTSTITFSWLVGPHALAYKGNVRFIVCLKESEYDGTVLREFNTTIATLPVLEGLEVDAAPLEGDLVDILAQLESLTTAKINAVEAASAEQVQIIREKSEEEQANIKGTADYIRSTFGEDYETTVKLQRTRANAIIETVEGNDILVDDSSNDPLRGLRVFGKSTQVSTTGKQLIKCTPTPYNSHGVSFIPAADGSVRIIGTATDNAYFIIDHQNPVPVKETELVATLVGTGNVYMVVGYIKADHTIHNAIETILNNTSVTFTYPAEAVLTRTFLGVNKGATIDTVVYPMIRLATIENDAHEPYSGGLPTPSPNNPSEIVSIGPDIDISINGENILPYPYTQGSRTVNGCTFTDNGDGSINLSGTPTDYADVTLTNTLVVSTDMCISLLGNYENVTLSALLSCGGVQIANYTTNNSSKHIMLRKNDYPKDTVIDLRLKRTGNDKAISGTAYPIVVGGTVAPVKYVPYTNTQSMQLNRVLFGIPVDSDGNYTDDGGQHWICDEVDFERGVHIKRINEKIIEEADIINVNTAYADYGTYTTVALNDVMNNNTEAMAISDRLLGIRADCRTGSGYDDKYRCYVQTGVLYLRFPAGTGEKTLAECKAAFVGSTIRYALATPIETPLTNAELAGFKALHSNFPSTTVINDAGATMELTYNADTKTWLENLPKASDEQVQTAVDNWLSANYVAAEGVKF